MAKKESKPKEEEEIEEVKELKPEWKIFAQEYVLDWNGTRAYKVAYPRTKTDSTAASCAYKLLRNAQIANYIEEIQKDIAKLCGVSVARNVNELRKIAYSNLSDFKEGWMTEKDFKTLTEDQKAALSEIQYTTTTTEYGTNEIVKFKVHDKQRAIEIMNKMLGWNSPEKLDLTSDGESISPIQWVKHDKD